MPINVTLRQECPYEIGVWIDPESNTSNAANVIIHYDSDRIDIIDSDPSSPGVQIDPDNAYEYYADNVVDTSSGEIRLTGYSINSVRNNVRRFAVIRFRSKPGVTSAGFTFELTGIGDTLDSNIAHTTTSDDVLGSVQGWIYSFVEGPCEEEVVVTEEPVCGNGILESGEQCDLDVGDTECSDFPGFSGGELECDVDCRFDLAQCVRTRVEKEVREIQEEEKEREAQSLLEWLFDPQTMDTVSIGASSTGFLFIPASWMLAFPAIIFRSTKKPWGLVYDKNARRPIAFATVRLYLDGKIVAEKVTDLQGRYGFAVEDGIYEIEVTHGSYQPFRTQMKISAEEPGGIGDANRDIPLTPFKEVKIVTRNGFREILGNAREIFPKLSQLLYLFGVAFSIVATVVNPINYNRIILVIYLIEGIIFLLWQVRRRWGLVYDTVTKKGIAKVFVRLFDPKGNKLIDNQITDSQGRYTFIVDPGIYHILASMAGYVFPSRKEQADLKKAFYGALLEVEVKRGESLAVDLGMDPMEEGTRELLKQQGKEQEGEWKFGSLGVRD